MTSIDACRRQAAREVSAFERERSKAVLGLDMRESLESGKPDVYRGATSAAEQSRR